MSRKGNSKRGGQRRGSAQRESGVRAKKHLGQHFLTDATVARRIADCLELADISNVLEIGPGTGILTRYLLARPVELLAVELDPESVRFLQDVFPLQLAGDKLPYRSFTVLEADFLKLRLEEMFIGEPFAITGNFPYNISTQIVFKMLENRDRVPEFAGMFQKEVAERICAGPGSKTYGILSVLVQAYYRAEYLFTVPPEVFDPPPRVHSGVLRLERLPAEGIDWDEASLYKLVKTAFNQRRKTLRNSLKTLQLPDYLTEDTIFDRRPEQLAVPEFIELAKRISDDSL